MFGFEGDQNMKKRLNLMILEILLLMIAKKVIISPVF